MINPRLLQRGSTVRHHATGYKLTFLAGEGDLFTALNGTGCTVTRHCANYVEVTGRMPVPILDDELGRETPFVNLQDGGGI